MKSFTRDLAVWIENNLEKKVLLDDVSVKAGYSKWYLQRVFRAETGITLATYIRNRKLYRAAMLLKMTRLPVIDITDRLGFSSQQTFNRTFKRHFGLAPGQYRASPFWHFSGLMPALSGLKPELPVPQLITVRLPRASGISLSYIVSSAKLDNVHYHIERRRELFVRADKLLRGTAALSVAQAFEPLSNNADQIKFSLTFTTVTQESSTALNNSAPFLRFPFCGTPDQLTEMQVSIYQHVMPFRQEARREGHDFFVIENSASESEPETFLRGFYYVPVTDTKQ